MDAITPIADFDDKTYNPFAIDSKAYGDIEDIYGILARLRQQGSVRRGDFVSLIGWVNDPNYDSGVQFTVLGAKEVMIVDGDPHTYSVEVYEHSIGQTFGRTLSLLGPEEHLRMRRVFQKAFLPNTVAKWGDDLVSPVVNGLIDQFAYRGESNLADDFTVKYPFEIIYRQLALPQRDIKTFHKLAVALNQTYGDFIRYGREASRKVGRYIADLIAERRKVPGDDLVSLLIRAEVDSDRIPDEIIVSFFRQLLNAAGDTTYRGTGSLLVGLLRNPQFLEEVRADRSLIPSAIEEMLRWEGPVAVHFRMATRDVRLGGVDVPKGAIINVCTAAANHDPEIFPDPELFDIHRKRERHFGFGHGPHMCLGQHLARLEMTRALNAILDRLPNLRLDPAKPQPRIDGVYMRTPHDINVLFDKMH
jgi:cytochrome P450